MVNTKDDVISTIRLIRTVRLSPLTKVQTSGAFSFFKFHSCMLLLPQDLVNLYSAS